MSVNPHSSIFQGAQDVNLLHPAITMVNNVSIIPSTKKPICVLRVLSSCQTRIQHACNAEANEESRALSPESMVRSFRRRKPMACTNCRSRKLKVSKPFSKISYPYPHYPSVVRLDQMIGPLVSDVSETEFIVNIVPSTQVRPRTI